MLGEAAACATVSLHSYILSYIQAQCFLPLRQPHSDFGDYDIGVCYVMKITIANSNPNTGLLTNIVL